MLKGALNIAVFFVKGGWVYSLRKEIRQKTLKQIIFQA